MVSNWIMGELLRELKGDEGHSRNGSAANLKIYPHF